MKKILFTLAVTAFITATSLSSCMSSSPKDENVDVKEVELKAPVIPTKSEMYITHNDSLTALQQFKAEYEKKIIANEKRAAELKTSFADATKENKAIYEKKLAELEKKNNDLKTKLSDYKEDGTEKWQMFKKSFKTDMDELGKALADFTVDSKK